MNALAAALARLGAAVTAGVWRLGYATRFFGYLLLHSGTAFRRFHLTMREIYFAGVLSLIIILVSGMFVGMVLALQGYETLQRYGSSEALGTDGTCSGRGWPRRSQSDVIRAPRSPSCSSRPWSSVPTTLPSTLIAPSATWAARPLRVSIWKGARTPGRARARPM